MRPHLRSDKYAIRLLSAPRDWRASQALERRTSRASQGNWRRRRIWSVRSMRLPRFRAADDIYFHERGVVVARGEADARLDIIACRGIGRAPARRLRAVNAG